MRPHPFSPFPPQHYDKLNFTCLVSTGSGLPISSLTNKAARCERYTVHTRQAYAPDPTCLPASRARHVQTPGSTPYSVCKCYFSPLIFQVAAANTVEHTKLRTMCPGYLHVSIMACYYRFKVRTTFPFPPDAHGVSDGARERERVAAYTRKSHERYRGVATLVDRGRGVRGDTGK